MSKFFCESPSVPENDYLPTIILDTEISDDNSVKVVRKSVEVLCEPLSALSFSDFNLQKLLRSGISYKSLQIPTDLRMNHDIDFVEFDNNLESISDQLFNKES